MPNISREDLFKASDVIGAVFEATTLPEYASILCSTLPRLIDSEMISYNEIDSANSRALIMMEPFPEFIRKNQDIFEHTVDTHPYLRHFQEHGGAPALRISDIVSQTQFRETSVYREFYRFLSVKDQVVTFLSSTNRLHIGIALTRSSACYSTRDRDLFEFLRPHLLRAYKSVRRISELLEHRRALQKTLEIRNVAVAMSTRVGEITFISPQAEELVRRWFALSDLKLSRLPGALIRESLSDPLAVTKLQFSKKGNRLAVTIFPEAEQTCFIFAELENDLEARGLSPREIEVLKWITEGKRNDEIGTILEISPQTVKRHVDHILEKLGVETRTAAALEFHRAKPQ